MEVIVDAVAGAPRHASCRRRRQPSRFSSHIHKQLGNRTINSSKKMPADRLQRHATQLIAVSAVITVIPIVLIRSLLRNIANIGNDDHEPFVPFLPPA